MSLEADNDNFIYSIVIHKYCSKCRHNYFMQIFSIITLDLHDRNESHSLLNCHYVILNNVITLSLSLSFSLKLGI
jgi:hypothetical protein